MMSDTVVKVVSVACGASFRIQFDVSVDIWPYIITYMTCYFQTPYTSCTNVQKCNSQNSSGSRS